MKYLTPALIGLALASIGSSVVLAAAASDSKPAAPVAPAASPDQAVAYKAMLTRYCVGCHNAKLLTAGLDLSAVDLNKVSENAPALEKVVRKLQSRMMPPPGLPRPDEPTTDAFLAWAQAHLDQAAAKAPDPGRVVLHRLNRDEYANAVRDLFALEVSPAALLPQDDTSDGFDNVADVLQVSPVFLDQYISAARTVAITAVGDAKIKPTLVSLTPTPGNSQGSHIEGLPLGTRGGFLTDQVFAAEGDYQFTIHGSKTFVYDYVLPDDRLLAMIDGKVVYDSAKDPTPPEKAPLGVARGHNFTFKAHLTGGRHKIGAAYVTPTYQASLRELSPSRVSTGFMGPTVVSAEVAGPTNAGGLGHTPSRDAIFICRPASKAAEEPCARKIVASLARRAFRRPVTDKDMEPPMRFFRSGEKVGGFETGVQQAIMAVLASPSFLYRTTAAPKGLAEGAAYPISDIDLASRLSFFLWSSIPDDELLTLAEQGRLKQPKVLEAQVRRMLADRRSESLVTTFGFQWLHLESLDTIDPDPNIFPEFDADLRAAYREEMRLFMGSVMHGDQSVLQLLNGDYTFVNERLARQYGIPNVVGNKFRRVKLDDPARWGLMGKGAVLTTTSYPNRTSPVLRGAWLLENILGTPPHAPPPGVGALTENVDGQKALTVREQMAVHRKQASCNYCHGIMDPIGLSLDNFDAIGGWRLKDRFAGETIDASSVTVTGERMNGVNDLRAHIAKQPEQFVQTFTERLMIYGLGRSVTYHDMPAIRAIVRGTRPSNYRFSDLVMGVVRSDQFRMSKTPAKAPPIATAVVASNTRGSPRSTPSPSPSEDVKR
jgi:mono/diheme cytochrome c family protein